MCGKSHVYSRPSQIQLQEAFFSLLSSMLLRSIFLSSVLYTSPPLLPELVQFRCKVEFFCLLHTLFYNMLPLFIGDPTSVLSVSWIPVVVGFLLRSHFFPGPRFTCVVSRSLHALFYNMLPLFIRDLACVYICFVDPRCGKFPFKILFLFRSWVQICGKSACVLLTQSNTVAGDIFQFP
jgi:hypothetical protein